MSDDPAACWEANAPVWTRLVREGHDVYRDALNTPAFLEMLPDVAGLAGLDIGCGEGANTRALARLGARMTGIDVAPSFVAAAREVEREAPVGVTYDVADAARLPFRDDAFDFATAFMSLMDMADAPGAVREAARVLKPGGFLQFSILHPCFVPPTRRSVRDAEGHVRAVEVADYFREADGSVEEWCFSTLSAEERRRTQPFRVPRFHRTLSSWVGLIVGSGLTIEAFGEPSADAALAAAHPKLADTRVAPIFLHVRARLTA